MTTQPRLKARDAFTLLEMMLAVTIMLMVFGMAVPVFRSQLRAMDAHASRFDTQQNARFAIATIDAALRVAGVGVLDEQPLIVQAAPFAVTFNADFATRDTASEGGAFGAVYLDPDLPAGSTMSMVPTAKVSLPLSSVLYPDTTYRGAKGGLSAAETISFWVALDGSGGSNGRYALFRRVNSGPIDTLARGLIIKPGDPSPFTYLVNNALGAPTAILPSLLPVYHVKIHGSAADTGATNKEPSLPDAIRAVKIHLVGTSEERDGTVSQRPADATIRLLNAGLLNHATCGETPIFGKPIQSVVVTSPSTVTLSWPPGTDESGGEKDVERYAIYRRDAAATDFGEPIASVPAGQSSYQFSDTQVIKAQNLVYGVAAIDCGSQPSALSVTAPILIP
ncbi:MAG: prepilin-type N-terminal cleavage/methylation domain-containing protein [Gemmatimonadaceae bacterium]